MPSTRGARIGSWRPQTVPEAMRETASNLQGARTPAKDSQLLTTRGAIEKELTADETPIPTDSVRNVEYYQKLATRGRHASQDVSEDSGAQDSSTTDDDGGFEIGGGRRKVSSRRKTKKYRKSNKKSKKKKKKSKRKKKTKKSRN